MALNQVTLHGNITRELELRFTRNEKAFLNLGLAINERWKGEDGETREETVFVNCTAWGGTAEVIARHLSKGDPIIVWGRLRNEEWKDKETGKDMRTLSITLEGFSFCGTKSNKGEADGPPPGTPPAARSVPSSKTDQPRASRARQTSQTTYVDSTNRNP